MATFIVEPTGYIYVGQSEVSSVYDCWNRYAGYWQQFSRRSV